jgi:hypothetical protein
MRGPVPNISTGASPGWKAKEDLLQTRLDSGFVLVHLDKEDTRAERLA